MIVVLAVAAAGYFVISLPKHVRYTGTATVGVTDDLDSDAGQHLRAQFEAIGPEKLQGRGRIGVVTVSWTAAKQPDPRCETQLLITIPTGWQLVGWTPTTSIANGTIVGVDDIYKKRPDLQLAQLFVLPLNQAGAFSAAWRYVQGDPAFSNVSAHIAQRCGSIVGLGQVSDLK